MRVLEQRPEVMRARDWHVTTLIQPENKNRQHNSDFVHRTYNSKKNDFGLSRHLDHSSKAQNGLIFGRFVLFLNTINI